MLGRLLNCSNCSSKLAPCCRTPMKSSASKLTKPRRCSCSAAPSARIEGKLMKSIKRLVVILAAALATFAFQAIKDPEPARWGQEARSVTIVRDDFGIAHIYGKTDANTVFGTVYAQAEDDFNRVETNYINAMGRLAETEGESKIYQDLRMKIFIDPNAMQKQYESSPEWLKNLMNGFADGLNYYLSKHPEVKPSSIKRFEPWMALSFTQGSIGAGRLRANPLAVH